MPAPKPPTSLNPTVQSNNVTITNSKSNNNNGRIHSACPNENQGFCFEAASINHVGQRMPALVSAFCAHRKHAPSDATLLRPQSKI